MSPYWTGSITFHWLLIVVLQFSFDDQEWIGMREQRLLVAWPGHTVVEPPDSHRTDALVHQSSPQGAGEGEETTTTTFFEVVERKEVGVELMTARSGWWGFMPVEMDVERRRSSGEERMRCDMF
jgi:hypothetical protein